MKRLKIILPILIFTLFIGLLLEGFAYVNLLVSEKYETQVEGIPDADKEKEKLRKLEIEEDKKKTKSESVVIGILIIVLLFIYLHLDTNNNSSSLPIDKNKSARLLGSFVFGFDREMPLFIKQMPLALKILIAGIPILTVVFYSYYSTLNGRKNSEKFYKKGFSSVVVKSNTSEGRTSEFHLKNGLKIYFWLSSEDTILPGDSICKYENTHFYDVYRVGIQGRYVYYGTYDFSKMK